MKKCKIHGVPLKQGGCFQNVYEWCPKCELADTEPMQEFELRTPTQPLFTYKLYLQWIDGTYARHDEVRYAELPNDEQALNYMRAWQSAKHAAGAIHTQTAFGRL